MILEHQLHMHNFITRLAYEGTIALQQYGKIDHLKSKVDSFLQYLLFVEESPLTNAVKGSAAYAGAFQRQGPFDPHGRSLRQLDLQTRLFKYPCSYLIYTEPFDAMPAEVKAMVYKRLWEILTNEDKSPKFAALTASDRQAVLEILQATKPGLPDYWLAGRESAAR